MVATANFLNHEGTKARQHYVPSWPRRAAMTKLEAGEAFHERLGAFVVKLAAAVPGSNAEDLKHEAHEDHEEGHLAPTSFVIFVVFVFNKKGGALARPA